MIMGLEFDYPHAKEFTPSKFRTEAFLVPAFLWTTYSSFKQQHYQFFMFYADSKITQ
jgi:hypothetical protein